MDIDLLPGAGALACGALLLLNLAALHSDGATAVDCARGVEVHLAREAPSCDPPPAVADQRR